MKDFLHHLFLPRESNNHRPRLLHHQSMLFLIIALLISQVLLTVVKTNFSKVLGTTTDISSEVLLLLTNQEREKQHLPPFVLNDELSQAASLKAEDMFAKNYWAHNGPDGTTPWFFFKEAGYNYVYAGENLARGFSTSDSVVRAWMESSTHRENILSDRYRDIGFAVMDGRLLGENTTLVVEMFGNREAVVSGSKEVTRESPVQIPQPVTVSVSNRPFIDSFSMSKNLGMFILLMFIFVLVLDMIIIERRKIIRFVGHNLDHIVFLSLILLMISMMTRGVIL